MFIFSIRDLYLGKKLNPIDIVVVGYLLIVMVSFLVLPFTYFYADEVL